MNEKEITKAFDEMFCRKTTFLVGGGRFEKGMSFASETFGRDDILAFIVKSLSEQRKEICEAVKKLKDMTTTEFGEETVSRFEVLSIINGDHKCGGELCIVCGYREKLIQK